MDRISRHFQPMKITTFALIAAAMSAAAIGVTATAHAEGADYLFQSPSGNIACDFTNQAGGKAHLLCAIDEYTYPAPPINGATQQPCTDHHNWFNMEQGMTPDIICDMDGSVTTPLLHRAGLWTLGYGQQLSAGAISCDSGPTGMLCTDSSTGHFFRVSRESYQLG